MRQTAVVSNFDKNSAKRMKLTFEKPENGWVSVKFEGNGFFAASRIPENPINQFCNNLIQSAEGVDTITTFNIEPELYFFKIVHKNDNFNFDIIHREKPSQEISVFNKNGTFEEIILPLFRSVKKFSTLDNSITDWKKIDLHKIEKLDIVIAKQKGVRK